MTYRVDCIPLELSYGPRVALFFLSMSETSIYELLSNGNLRAHALLSAELDDGIQMPSVRGTGTAVSSK